VKQAFAGPLRRHWASLAAAAAVLALGSLVVSGVPFRLETDDVTYLALAASHAAGTGLVVPGELPPTGLHFPPGWPLLLSNLFAIGLSLRQVTWIASALNTACFAAATGVWARIFSRRIGPTWGLLSALWGAMAFPVLLLNTSASSEGTGALLVALLALVVMRDGPAASLSPGRRAAALGLAMAGLALLRTQLLFLWPLALWHVRDTLPRRYLVAALAAAAALAAGVTLLAAPSPSGPGYLALTAVAWHGGLSSPGAHVLRANLTAHLWNGVAWLVASPLPWSRVLAAALGPPGLSVMTFLVCLGLVYIALRERRGGLPVLVAAPVALVLPFVLGYPYAVSPRLLVPAAPLLGYLAVAGVRRVLRGAPRLAAALVAAWLLFGAAWWVQLAPRYRATQQRFLAGAERVVDALTLRGGRAGSVCAEQPEVLWAASAGAHACRLVTTAEFLVPAAQRNAAVRSRLDRTGVRCVVGATAAGTQGDVGLPLAEWGFQEVLRTVGFSAWCRTGTANGGPRPGGSAAG